MSLIIGFTTFVMTIFTFTEKISFWFGNGSLNTCGHVCTVLIFEIQKICTVDNLPPGNVR